MPAGRPKLLNDELLEKARTYLSNLPEDEVVHSIEGLALYVGIARDTVYAWEKEHPIFSDIVGAVREKQAKKLINGSLDNKLNASISKMMLSKHGYREATETDITSGGESISPILVKFIDGK